jgi:hypothetical protein
MALARRTRMVSIRLSDEEFEKLKGRCEQFGERTLSDIAREAMYLLLDTNHSNGHSDVSADNRIKTLESRVDTLQYELFRLNGLIENLSCKST